MIRRRAAAAGIETKIGNQMFRATGITAYLKNGRTLEKAAAMANHASAHDAAVRSPAWRSEPRPGGAGGELTFGSAPSFFSSFFSTPRSSRAGSAVRAKSSMYGCGKLSALFGH